MTKAKKKKGVIASRILIGISVLMVLICILILGMGFYVRTHYEMQLPDDFFRLAEKRESPHFFIFQFEDRTDRIGEAVEVTSNAFAQKQNVYVAYPDIPQNMIDAFVAIEDKRFYEHRGVDWYRTVAAGVNYILGFSDHFGASTITQQLVKNMTGNSEVTLSRKMQEILYAKDLERRLDKSEIMELYLNIIHFSDDCDGIAQASMHYFSKMPSELTLAETASIAAITNSPSYYNPIRHPEHNLTRRNIILREMLDQGYITFQEYESACIAPLQLRVDDSGAVSEGINSWYVDMVLEDVINDLIEEYGISRSLASQYVLSGGLRIDMAMDPEIQKLVEDYYRTAVTVPKNEKGESAQSALIVIDSRTGDILGVAGEVGDKTGNRVQNFATQTKRPPGSALKPITVYAPALEQGIINWASVYDDVPVEFNSGGNMVWPRNATGVYRGLTNISYAVAHSTNTVAVRVLQELGLETSYRIAKERFHLSGMVSEAGANDRDLAALALGQLNYGVTLRELTAAYTVFADRGVYHPYRSYYRVLDADGNILLACPDAAEVVLSEGNAAIMTKLLQGVVDYGTSSSITLKNRVECAGKTGTTNADGDRWFVGYTPELICGVWCGYEYPEPLEGRNLCTNIWNRVMSDIVEEKGGKDRFDIPQNVIRASYCRDSGKLLSDACGYDPRGNRSEIGWFLKENMPTSFCDCHVLCDYDSEHGGISHGNCPDSFLKKVALIKAERRFPMQIYVSDAQYVYRGDPLSINPNENEKQPYFANEVIGYYGASPVEHPFNRSCKIHLYPPDDAWDYLIPRFYETEEE